jgi:AhpD family alkylhydroperoxidase
MNLEETQRMETSTSQYQDVTRKIRTRLKDIRRGMPAIMQSFQELGAAATAEGALSAKTKELIALAIGVTGRCEGCVGFHAQALVRLGATRAEVEEMLAVAIYMGGGPSMMWATEAMAAFDEFAAQQNTAQAA